MSHTPGSWLVHPITAHVVPAAELDLPICALLWPTEERSEEETQANATLIAAAPDLLAALQEIEFKLAGALPPYCRSMALKAIAKATGEA